MTLQLNERKTQLNSERNAGHEHGSDKTYSVARSKPSSG